MELRDVLKMMRNELGVNQEELANELHVSFSSISRWETGKTLPNRSALASLSEYAGARNLSADCRKALSACVFNVKKAKITPSKGELYSVEHASLRQLIDEAAFPIYVCDIKTDELLYLNQKTCAMVGAGESAVGRKCYECLMHRDTPCEFCRKNELVEGKFKSNDAYRSFDGTAYNVQGKLLQWNGRKAQVRYLLDQGVSPKRPFTGAKTAGDALRPDSEESNAAPMEKLILQSIETEKSARQLQAVFENINGGVSVAVYEDDDKARLAYANDRYYTILSYTKQQFALELKGPYDTLHPDDYEAAMEAIAKVKNTRQAAAFRYRIVKRDKSIADILCSSSVASIDGLGDKVLISVLSDITATVQAEQTAVAAGRRLDAILKNMKNAVTAAIIKNDGSADLLFTNDLYHEMLGYTREQYQNEAPDPFRLIHPDDADAVRRAVMEPRRVGETKKLRYRVVSRDGQIKWFSAAISVISLPGADQPVQLSVLTDVTDLMKTNERLASQHHQIVDMLNEIPSGIAVVEVDPADVTGTLHAIYYNDRFFGFSGYSRDEYDELLKKNKMAFVFDDDIPTLQADTERICAGEIGASVDSVVRCRTKGGELRWLLLTGQLVQRRGDICMINIAVVDVTARQEAADRQRINEEMLRIAAETDKRAMTVFDVKNSSCRVESRALFSSKYGETFDNVPQSIIDRGVLAPDSVNEFRSLFERIRNGEQKITVSLQMRSGPDKYEWFECNAATVFDDDRQPDHAVLVFHNITEQRVKEAVFKKWQQSIKTRAPESYTLFRCNLSKDASLDEHDGSLLKIALPPEALSFNSRTKLYVDEFVYPDDRETYTALLNSDTLLAMFYRGEHSAALEYRETIKNGEIKWRRLTLEMVEYLNSTDIQVFLMYEDIDEAKKAEIKARETAEADPLTGTLNRAAFTEKVDEIIRGNPSAHGAMIMLDMDGFKELNDSFGHAAGDQALQDVVAVLRSYAHSGDLVCRLGGDEFLVWLRDIPYDAVIAKTARQMCEHIRKAYSQDVQLSASAGIAVYPRDGQSYDELYPNADMALYRVKQAGKGSYAFFSVTEEDQTPELAEALSAVRQAPQSSRGPKRRILIVDDNESSRIMLKGFFKDNYLIEATKNGAEAMICLRHFGTSISVVLLDLLMPGVDGFAVLKKMQSSTKLRTIPVIVVTGDEERSTLLKAIELGAADYVTKPVDADLIRMRVQSAISKAENERLRAQNSYLVLQRDEEVKYRTVLKSTGTVVVEYDWRTHVFIYDNEISKHIAGNFDHRGLWQVLLSDMVASSADVKATQDIMIALANNMGKKQDGKIIKLKTPDNQRHWFRMNIYKSENEFGVAEKMIITFNDVHEEVLANDKLLFQATRDELTGLYNRAGFIEKAAELIAAKEPGYYVLACIDIERFKVINDQYGTASGDEVLRKFAQALEILHRGENGICCRVMADNFAVLYPARLLDSPELENSHFAAEHLDSAMPIIQFAAGRCLVDDKTLDVSAIYDRAVIAKNTIKGRYDTHIATFDESMRTAILRQQEITGQMNSALENGQFEVWLQPQFNHATGMLSGAEALVRWRHPIEGIISPAEFIPIFERNGFVYEVDKYVWEQTCILLRKWLDKGLSPVPVSVNISRYDVFRDDLIDVIEGLVKKYGLPLELLRLEITESAFTESADQIIKVVLALVDAGYTVEIDDFGSGYSSLNTLKDVPAQILKMDMRFLENDKNAQRGGSIIESVVRMAKWLGMSVIAEGVETIEQADYLKSIGCEYIQGYLYSRPQQAAEYEALFAEGKTESKLGTLKSVAAWNNNAFWNPSSMETLIFNSYVGGACIFEYHDGKTELLRYNADYAEIFGNRFEFDRTNARNDILSVMDAENAALFHECIANAAATKKETSCEVKLLCGNREVFMYIRATMRQIAEAGQRRLFYCVVSDNTEQRLAEKKAQDASERVSAVMDNSHCGISAAIAHKDGMVEYLFVNNRFYELLGYTKEQYETEVKSPFDCVHPEDRKKVFDTVTQLTKIGDTVSLRIRDVRRDGAVVWLRCDISLVKFADIDRPVQMSSFIDITEQVENEMKQMENAKQLEVVMSNVNGGVSAIQIFDDATSRFIFNNERYYELYGYTQEQAREERLDVMTLILPEDLPSVMEKVRKLKADRLPAIIDYRIKKRDGSRALLRVNASLMSIPGYGDDVITSVVTDITENKSTEEKLSAVVNNINGGVSATYLRENNPEFVIVNDRYYDVVGYTKEQFEAEVTDVFNLVHPDDRERVERLYREAAGNQRRFTMEYRVVRRDGTVRNILNNTSVIHLFGIEEPVQLAVSTDITELREAQREQLATMDRLQTVMNVMSNGMTAVAFHEEETSFLFANNRYYEMHGIQRGSIGEDHLSSAIDLVVPEDRELVQRTVQSAQQTGQAVSAAYRIRRPDGAIRWLNATINVTNLVGVAAPVQVTVFTDITEIEQANSQLRFLNDSARDILAQSDSEAAIQSTLQSLMTYFASARAYVVELDYDKNVTNNTYEVCAEGVGSEMDNLRGVPFGAADFWYEALCRGEFLAIENVRSMDDSLAELREMLLAQGVSAIALAPLRREGRLIGFVGVDNPTRATERFTQLTSIADYMTFVLTRRDLSRKIAHDMNAIETLMNDTPGGFVRIAVHPGGNPTIASLNDGMCRMLDMTYDEAMAAYGGDVHLLFTPAEIEETAKMVKEARECCGQYSCKCTLHGKDGKNLPVMAFGRFVKDENGGTFLNAYFTDISKQMEAEEKQKMLLDNLPSGAALYEFDGTNVTLKHINKQYWKLVEREPVDYGKASVMSAIHPDDREIVRQEIAAAIRQNRKAEVNARIICKKNDYKPFNMTANITREKNGLFLLYVSYTPISDDTMYLQKMLPVALSTMMAASDDIAYVKDRDMHYICVSQPLADMAGYKSTRDLIGKSAYDLFEPQCAQRFTEDDRRVVETCEPVIGTVERIPFADGSTHLGRTSKFPIMGASGKAFGVYCVYHDVTTQQQKESQLELLTSTIPGGLAAYSFSKAGFKTLYFNEGYYKYSGYTREEYTAMIEKEPLALMFEEDRHKLRAMLKSFAAEKKNGMTGSCDYRCRTKDGSCRYMNLNAALTQLGEEQYILNVVQIDVTEQQEEKERLRLAEEEYRIATLHSGHTIGRYNIAAQTLTISEEASNRLQLPECIQNVPYGRVSTGNVSKATADDYIAFYEKIKSGEKECSVTFQKLLSIGWRWINERATTVFDDDGKPVSAIISYTDVTEQQEKEAIYKKWQQTLKQKGSELYTLYQTNLNKDGSCDTKEGELLNFYPEFNGTMSFNERVELFIRQVVYEEDQVMYRSFLNSDTMLASYYRGKRVASIDFRAKMQSGEIHWLRLSVELVEYPNSTDVQAYMLYEDIDKAKRAELDTVERAETDPLTGILNRAAFISRMEQIVKNSAPGIKHTLLMLDVDNFKQVNDTQGHAAGDQVLIDLTAKIRSILRRDDLIGRMGGDEFFVFLQNIPNEEIVASKAKQICELEIVAQGSEKPVTASIGIAMVPKDGRDFDTLYRKVDAALYETKKNGKNGYLFAGENN